MEPRPDHRMKRVIHHTHNTAHTTHTTHTTDDDDDDDAPPQPSTPLLPAPPTAPGPSPGSTSGPPHPNISAETKQKITHLLSQVESLTGIEKLLLYLQLPSGPPRVDPLKQPLNPLGSRSEIHQTVMWIQTHLEVDPEISLPKQDVYDEYLAYCTITKMKPLSTADFGKVMKQVYPCVKPRRLGTRGNSRYCYAGMRKRVKLEVPQLPDLGEKQKTIEIPTVQNDLLIAASHLVREWAGKVLGLKFDNLCELAHHLIGKNYVDTSSMAATMLANNTMESGENESGNDRLQTKIHERGVIKQLKKKIQCQPSTQTKHREDDIKEENTPAPAYLTNVISVKNPQDLIKMENISSPVNYVSPRQRHELSRSVDEVPQDIPENARHFSQLPPEHFLSSDSEAAVNLASSYIRNHNQFPSQDYLRFYKNPNMPLRHPEYDHMRYNSYYNESSVQPHNLCINSYLNNPLMPPSQHQQYPEYFPLNSNLPINLSSNVSDGNESKMYKVHEKTYHLPVSNQSVSSSHEDSLNLSRAVAKKPWPSQSTSSLPQSSPSRLPLPGKKMILEAYNNELQANSPQSSESNIIVKPNVSPGKFAEALSRGEYLPKKMRASESLRIQSNPSAEVSTKDNEKNIKEQPTVTTSTPSQQPHNFVLNINVDLNISPNRSSTFQPQNISAIHNEPNESYQTKEYSQSSNSQVPDLIPFRKMKIDCKDIKKTQRSPRKKNLQSPDVANNNIVRVNVPKPRGRPRKNSPTKAKYTKRQRVSNSPPGLSKCDPVPNSSMLQPPAPKSEDVCEGKPTDILTRERVISVCNMDKDALDDYLLESNSQENEEELMKYFQTSSDSLSNDEMSKISDDLQTSQETDKTDKAVLSLLKNKDIQLTKTNFSNESDFLENNTDTQEDLSQSKDDKLTQIRELLESSLTHNANSLLSGSQEGDPTPKHFAGTSHPLSTASNGNESAFTSVTRRDSFNESSVSTSLGVSIPKQYPTKIPPECDAANLILPNRALSARRRVSFENQLQQLNFMPISPGPPSPTNNKISPSNQLKSNISPTKSKVPPNVNTSPTNSAAQVNSPFVSPRNTPIPRARNNCQVKPVPSKLQSKRIVKMSNSKLSNKCLALQSSQLNLAHKKAAEINQFAIPIDQTSNTCSTTRRNFPMSAPPSPNILAAKCKPNFMNRNIVKYGEVNAPTYVDNKICMPQFASNSFESIGMPSTEMCGDPQPHSADPLSHEVSQFFSGNVELGVNLPMTSIRSQSVPLNQSMIASNDMNQVFFNDVRFQNVQMNNESFLSYNNTPCSSVPQTPVPREFCDFGALNDTCESISKAGLNSENLDKIYNVLDSSVQNSLSNESCEATLMQPMNISEIGNYGTIDNVFSAQSGSEHSKRSIAPGNIQLNDVLENRFFASRSVPSTPLPFAKSSRMPTLSTSKISNLNHFRDEEYCSNMVTSKSVPSTPLISDSRNMFSYTNKDFLINGNSLEPSLGLINFTDKKVTEKDLEESLLEVIEDKTEEVLASLSGSPLPETIDMVNTGLVPFQEDMDIANELPTFTEQGISTESDLLGALDRIDTVSYDNL